jgi:adenylate cyclase
MNGYLDGMSEIVLAHEGTIDKFVGDAVVAFFGAPMDQPDHAERAVDCAIKLDEFAREFADDVKRGGFEFGRTRIGVHTGEVVVGNFGGSKRFDYTVFGDAVNTAARLESANAHLGTSICVSAATAGRCEKIRFRPIADLGLKGKSASLEVFEPVTQTESAVCDIAAYEQAFEKLKVGDGSAYNMFEELNAAFPGDVLVNFHLDRLKAGLTGINVVLETK